MRSNKRSLTIFVLEKLEKEEDCGIEEKTEQNERNKGDIMIGNRKNDRGMGGMREKKRRERVTDREMLMM